MLVSDIINQAFEALGVIRPGEAVTTAIQTSAFLVLGERWALAQLDRAMSNQVFHQSFTLTAGTSIYTVGTGGSLVSTANPIRITGWASVSGNFRNGGSPMSFEEFAAKIKDPLGASTVLVQELAADNAAPPINIRVFPTPAASPGALILDYFGQMTQFATVGDTLSFAPGYNEFLRTDLAMALYPQYARATALTMQALAQNLANAKNTIRALNAEILGLVQAPAPAGAAA